MLSRLIRLINVSIAILVLMIAGLVYWFAMRPLPKTSGEITAPVTGAAVVKRDARGVPHIEASTWQDAIFLQGYVTAQDRLWQMDGLRRFGAGELAEVFGKSTLQRDERARKMRMRAMAEADRQRLTPEERAVFVEYARGVNHFIDTHRGEYSLEFSMPGHSYDPRPWTVVDSILVGLVMYDDLADSASLDLYRGRALAMANDISKMKFLYPAVQGYYVNPGSNAWAVSGAHTADGKPMLANDPHLSYGIPCTWHLVHLKAPGLNVSGAALPGVPGVITGHNEQIAWGVTSLQADVMDLYRERLDEQTGRYAFQGHLEQAQLETQFIGVRDSQPVPVNTWVTRHGPVIASENGVSLAMRWSAMDGFGFPFWAIDRARNWQDFRTAVGAFWGPAQNFVYADRSGNIGYQAGGRIPIRRQFDGDVPVDGEPGKFEWDGYIPFDQLPSEYNPPSGVIITANQNPFAPDYQYRVNGSFHDRYRAEQICDLLRAKRKLDISDMLAIQKDVYSAYDRFLAHQAVAAVARRGASDEIARRAAEILRRWNGQMDKNDAAPMITQLLSNEMGAALWLSVASPALAPSGSRPPVRPGVAQVNKGNAPTVHSKGEFVPEIMPRPGVIESLLRKRPAGWVPADDWDGWILKNLVSALEIGRRRQGSPVSKWRWGRMLQWNIQHPVGKQLPLVDRYFDIGPVEMSGSGTTVKQTTATLGPSERMVVDLGDLEKSVQNLPTGESGFVASGHYKDQWPAYYVGQSFPMEFQSVDAKEILRVRPAPASK
jgi:penicillin G amidase